MRITIGPYPFTPTQNHALHQSGITPQKFTINQYVQMAETGILTPDYQTELIDGIVMKMSPTDRPHSHRLNHIARTLARQLPDNLLIVEATVPSLHPTAKPNPNAMPKATSPNSGSSPSNPQKSKPTANRPGQTLA